MAGSGAWSGAQGVELSGFGGGSAQRTTVRAMWNEEFFFFEFVCRDSAIHSPGARDGLDHFLLGDTVEVFLARRGAKEYAEVHATPAGRTSFYFCCDYRRPAEAPAVASGVRVGAEAYPGGWRAVLAVPRALAPDHARGREYDVFFARYDYEAAEGKPVLSSFPAQHGTKPDFHRREDYAVLRLTQ